MPDMSKVPPQFRERVESQNKGVGVSHKTKPICCLFPITEEGILRAMENRSEYIRKAVTNQLKADGLIP